MLAAVSAFSQAFSVAPQGVSGARRSAPPQMMPSGTPRVPYRYPGTELTQWVDIYNRMYRERIIFLGEGIDDNYANNMIAVMLYLESDDATAPVSMYFNVPGGATKPGLAMHDTMQMMPYKIQTVNLGMCAQISAFLVASGTPGARMALPNARFLMTNPRIDPPRDNEGRPIQRPMQATEMRLEVAEVLRDKKRLLGGFSKFTGRSIDTLETDFKRDFFLSGDEAVEYGLIDRILAPKPKRGERVASDAGQDFNPASVI